MKILYVEDNAINVMVMQRTLTQYQMEIAVNGREALEKATHKVFDLVLMDINLGPGEKDGVSVMKDMKQLEGYIDIPFFAVTAYAANGDKEKFLREGFSKYFQKPIDFELLNKGIGEFAI